MSAKKPRSRTPKKKEERKVEKKEKQRRQVTIPAGRIPAAFVSSRHEGTMVQRHGRGFSVTELHEADLPLPLARRWGIPVDALRRSALEPNVSALKGWHVPQKPESPARPVENIVEPIKKARRKKSKRANRLTATP